eukprot:TRINITY_DN7811_c0_g1_i1.p1 TRINITY_DN7811_c0_g1~~TRINITY_DN7811_c0_g1_i1.p1  ORF type:complete len:274 (+),score=70.37 TRINITY_DN7811_c0_g1_i1:91-822(+)
MRVIQRSLAQITVVSADNKLELRSKSGSERIDYVFTRSLFKGRDFKERQNKLFTIHHSNTPVFNDPLITFLFMDKPTITGFLKSISTKELPVYDQSYYPDHRSLLITPSYPLLATVASTKYSDKTIQITNTRDFADFRSVIALHGDYTLLETANQFTYTVILETIGDTSTAYKIESRADGAGDGAGAGVGGGVDGDIQKIELTDRYIKTIKNFKQQFDSIQKDGLQFFTIKIGDDHVTCVARR